MDIKDKEVQEEKPEKKQKLDKVSEKTAKSKEKSEGNERTTKRRRRKRRKAHEIADADYSSPCREGRIQDEKAIAIAVAMNCLDMAPKRYYEGFQVEKTAAVWL